MSFTLWTFTRQTEALNAGQVVTTFNPGTTPVYINGPALFSYVSYTETIAEIGASNYFLEVINDLAVNDFIMCVGTDASLIYQVATSDPTTGSITVQSFTPAGSVGTSNIESGAVTTAKIANNAVTTGLLANNAVGSAQLALNVLQLATITLTATQFKALYATPVSVISAPGSGNIIVIDKVLVVMDYGTTQYAAGGPVGLQYGNTAELAGEAASATIAAANLTGSASVLNSAGGTLSAVPTSDAANVAVYISNSSAAFTTGDSTFTVSVWYKVVAST